MGNPELHELIDLPTASRLIDGAAVVAIALAALFAFVALSSRARRAQFLAWAGAVIPWAVLLPVGWRVYLWRVRYDPATGFCGLHSVRVLLENLLAAVIVGVLYGLYLRWLWGMPRRALKDQSATRED